MVSRWQVFSVLGLGVVAVSFASVLIRLSAAPSIVIAAGRMAVAAVVLSPFFWHRFGRSRRELGRLRWGAAVLPGLLLAAHFALWIESLNRTTVTSSVVLVAMNPIFAALLSAVLLREKPGLRTGLAIVLGVAGALVVAGPSLRSGISLSGNLLALGGALCAAGYLIAGRGLRSGLSLLSYIYIVYITAAIALIAIVLAGRVSLVAVPPRAWLFIVLLALGPQLVGHTSFNWALRFLPAPVVAMAVLGEPVGTTLLAWALLRQAPTGLELLGGAVVCAGIYLAATDVHVAAIRDAG
uniref:DMT family transporter n=1 Tax=candidate division WOR-3 bacterium TaxID=2052148 RepID=A0A7C4GCY1_UNCW3